MSISTQLFSARRTTASLLMALGGLQTIAGAEEIAQKFIKQGVALEFSAAPLQARGTRHLKAGEEARLSFKLTDSVSGKPVTGLSLAGWMDLEKPGATGISCKDRIQSYLQGTLAYRPDLSLNAWYILTLNASPSVTVIDPLGGYGGQNTLAMPGLPSPAEDAVVSPSRKHVYISMPEANRVAVLDTATWKLTRSLDAGPTPAQIAIQPDRPVLWVANDAKDQSGGITVLDPASGTVLKRFSLGPGPHRIAFDAQARYAVATSTADGTVSLMDLGKMREIKRLKAGRRPIDLAYSGLADGFYVIDGQDGGLHRVDARRASIQRIADLAPGVRAIRFTADGRWGFILNYRESRGHVLDAATHRIEHHFDAPAKPYQIAFSATMAFIRGAASERFSTIALDALGKGSDELPLTSIAGGNTAPAPTPDLESLAAIATTPAGNSVLVANPADRNVYFFGEGMNAPQGSFSVSGGAPRGVMVVDRSLNEVRPGEYAATVTPPSPGIYQIALLVPSPRLWQCFEASVDPADAKPTGSTKPRLDYLMDRRAFALGEPITVRVRATDGATGQALAGIGDLEIISFQSPGLSQKRTHLDHKGAGVYETVIRPERPGAHLVLLRCPSLPMDCATLAPLTLQVTPAPK